MRTFVHNQQGHESTMNLQKATGVTGDPLYQQYNRDKTSIDECFIMSEINKLLIRSNIVRIFVANL